MSEALKLVLAQTEARPGEPFQCVLLLDPNDERVALARELTVRLEWRASQRDSDSFGRVFWKQREQKVEATWSPQLPLRMEYHVTLTLPDRAPLSYDGKVIVIEWALTALLDVPKRQNASLTVPLRVVPRVASGEKKAKPPTV